MDTRTPLAELWAHTAFNGVFFAFALLLSIAWTRFYFSNGREKRISVPLLGFTLSSLILFVLAGVATAKLEKSADSEEQQKGLTQLDFVAPPWRGHLKYDSRDYEVQKVASSSKATLYKIRKLEKDNEDGKKNEIRFVIREAYEDQETEELRSQRLRTDEKRQILGLDTLTVADITFKKWLYTKDGRLIQLIEAFCGPHILQMSRDFEKIKISLFHEELKEMEQLMKNLSPKCDPPPS